MFRPLLFAVVLFAPVIYAPLASADWLEWGRNPAKTGRTDQGPATDDVALSIQLPGVRGGHPLIIGRHAYVSTTTRTVESSMTPEEEERIRHSVDAVWRISLDSGEVERFIDVSGGIYVTASDGDLLFVLNATGMMAFDLVSREQRWFWPSYAGDRVNEGVTYDYSDCRSVAVKDGYAYPGCIQVSRPVPREVDPTMSEVTGMIDSVTPALAAAYGWHRTPSWTGVLAKVRILDGHELWRVTVGDSNPAGQSEDVAGIQHLGPTVHAALLGGAVTGNRIYALMGGVFSGYGAGNWSILPIDLDDGGIAGRFSSKGYADEDALYECNQPPVPTPVVGDENVVYSKINGHLMAFRKEPRFEPIWSLQVNERDPRPSYDIVGMPLLDGEDIYVPSASSLRWVNTRTHEVGWIKDLPTSAIGVETFGPWNALDQDRVYAVTLDQETWPYISTSEPTTAAECLLSTIPRVQHGFFNAFDRETGSWAWRIPLTNGFPATLGTIQGVGLFASAVAGGVAVISHLDGNVTVIGNTAASPRVDLALGPTGLYPPVGEVLQVDLTGSSPGIARSLSEYRAIWGDEADTGWQRGAPLLSHTYTEGGLHQARFMVRNELNQTASAFATFHVGAQPPAAEDGGDVASILGEEPHRRSFVSTLGTTLFSSPLGPWFLAAIALILLLGGLLVVHRRRSRLARELEKAERAFQEASANPAAAQAVVDERRAHASRLLMRHKLTTQEHALLVGRIIALESTIAARNHHVPLAFEPGTILFDKYRIINPLGEGSYGRTFLAEDLLVRREVVLKILFEKMSDDGVREARAIGAIRHPNVITLYDVTQLGKHPLLVMEYARNGSLQQRLDQGPISAPEFQKLVEGLLGALHAVHTAGALHRDVKPSNVLLDEEGNAKLADFGIAKLLDRTQGAPTVSLRGTLRYMAPEQARGHRATVRSDIYGAAVTLFEAWTGKPYVDTDARSASELQLHVASSGVFDRDVGPQPLREWFAKALAPEPEGRFRTAQEMLAGFTESWTVTVTEHARKRPSAPKVRRRASPPSAAN